MPAPGPPKLLEDQDGEIPFHDADEAGLYGGFSDLQAEEDFPPGPSPELDWGWERFDERATNFVLSKTRA
eukprot:5612045-Prorocentrum_lima.AAC.1